MRISELCSQAGISIRRGGLDRYGHIYEADEYHFDFQVGQDVVFLRHRSLHGSGRWFVNIRYPDGRDASLTFTQIAEADVAQVLTLYLWCEQRPETKATLRACSA